jgi:hypothetical protein
MLGLCTVSLPQTIIRAKDFAIWLHGKTNNREFPNGVREQTAMAIFQLSLDLHDAIIVLLDAKLPGPALSLARPLFEAYIRGFWLFNCASDKALNNFLNGECPSLAALVVAIENNVETDGAWIHANKNHNLISFHDLTHGGSEHVRRRNMEDSVEPNYPEEELEFLVNFGIEVQIRIGAELLSQLKDEDGIEQLHEMAQSFRGSS